MIYKFSSEALNRVRSKLEKAIKEQIEKPLGKPAIRLDASGNLKRSIRGVVFAAKDSIYMNIYGASYFDDIDKGGEPKNVSEGTILQWINNKRDFTLIGNSKKVAAKNIANAIRESGTIKRFNYGGAEIIDYLDTTYYEWITKEIYNGYYKDLEVELDNLTKNVNKQS